MFPCFSWGKFSRVILLGASLVNKLWLLFVFAVDQVGTYTELLQNEGAFSEFLKTFASEQNAEEDGL